MSPSRLKILHTVHSLEPGGMENGVVNVARLLDPRQFEVHVCCLERRGSFADRLPDPNHVTVLGKPPGFSWPTVFRLAKLIWRIRPHVIHSHNLGPLVYSALATGFGRWRPILHGEHGQLVNDQATPRLIQMRQRYYRACRKVHTVSNSLRQHLIEHGFPAAHIVALINGVDTGRFTPAARGPARQRIGLPEAGPVIGIVGRIDKNKRHAELITAFEQLVQRLPSAQLLVVGGTGPECERVQQMCNSSPAAARICFAGFQAEPSPYYQAMDLLASPSLAEGLSNVVLEAMASGVPVLCHDACGNTEVIQHGMDGFVADLTTPEQIAAQLMTTLGDEARLAEVSRQARAKVERDFSIASMVRGYERIYREVSGGR